MWREHRAILDFLCNGAWDVHVKKVIDIYIVGGQS